MKNSFFVSKNIATRMTVPNILSIALAENLNEPMYDPSAAPKMTAIIRGI